MVKSLAVFVEEVQESDFYFCVVSWWDMTFLHIKHEHDVGWWTSYFDSPVNKKKSKI